MSYSTDLRAKQNTFLKHLAYLIHFALDHGFTLSGGDLWRSEEEQKRNVDRGVSWTMDSQHRKRLAIDLNIFLDGYYLFSDRKRRKEDTAIAEQLGEYWESLGDDHVWGGRWESFDPYHFEIKF